MREARIGTLFVAGILLFQIGWFIAIPAFGGIDEFDHAYRAASVARGHWSPSPRPLRDGPGDLIRVPSDLVRAAESRCSILPYTGFGNCHAVSSPDRNGEVLVASTAARYNPIYPWLVGTPARPFSGSTALYVMRAMTILICDVLLFAAWRLMGRAWSTNWKRVATLVGITPVMLYATANAAPNGVQMCAGVLMWSAGIALNTTSKRSARPALWCFFIATATMLTVHSTGPLWAVCILATLLFWPGALSRLAPLWKTHRTECLGGTAAVALVALSDVLWSWSHATNLNWGKGGTYPPLNAAKLFEAFPLWVFQTIGSIPFRNEYVPTVVFSTSLVVFALLLISTVKLAAWRQRVVLLGICLTFFAVPSLLTMVSYRSLGMAWQGRYALPFAIGLPMLCGSILDDTERGRNFLNLLGRVAVCAFCLTQAVSIWAVAARERSNWPTDSLAPPPSLALFALLAIASAFTCASMWRRVHRKRQRSEEAQPIREAAYSQ